MGNCLFWKRQLARSSKGGFASAKFASTTTTTTTLGGPDDINWIDSDQIEFLGDQSDTQLTRNRRQENRRIMTEGSCLSADLLLGFPPKKPTHPQQLRKKVSYYTTIYYNWISILVTILGFHNALFKNMYPSIEVSTYILLTHDVIVILFTYPTSSHFLILISVSIFR